MWTTEYCNATHRNLFASQKIPIWWRSQQLKQTINIHFPRPPFFFIHLLPCPIIRDTVSPTKPVRGPSFKAVVENQGSSHPNIPSPTPDRPICAILTACRESDIVSRFWAPVQISSIINSWQSKMFFLHLWYMTDIELLSSSQMSNEMRRPYCPYNTHRGPHIW